MADPTLPDTALAVDTEPTGPTLTPDQIRALRAEYRTEAALTALAGAVERLEAATWTLVVRDVGLALAGMVRDVGLAFAGILGTHLAAPVWPGRIEVRVGTVILLAASLVALFGADRAWSVLPAIAGKLAALPSILVEAP